MAMQDLINQVKSKTLGAAEYFVPILKNLSFEKQFVVAGDHLVHYCPTWQWSAGEADKVKAYLPADKQFLVTKNVPCYRRCHQLESKGEDRIIELEGDAEGGWVDTHPDDGDRGEAGADRAPMVVKGQEKPLAQTGTMGNARDDEDEEDEDEAEDMENFVESGLLDQDDASTLVPGAGDRVKSQTSTSEEEGIEQTRTYDLHITYDKYYQTPRLWLVGYNENRKALSVEQMYEDFSADHAKKTITMETHPHITGPPMASIHPCRHAEVMKKIIQTVAEGGKELGVHNYLVIFLKFVQAVIPTIEYDYTRSFTFS